MTRKFSRQTGYCKVGQADGIYSDKSVCGDFSAAALRLLGASRVCPASCYLLQVEMKAQQPASFTDCAGGVTELESDVDLFPQCLKFI